MPTKSIAIYGIRKPQKWLRCRTLTKRFAGDVITCQLFPLLLLGLTLADVSFVIMCHSLSLTVDDRICNH